MYPPVYDLTPLTGQKSNENRTTVVANVEMKPRTKWVGLIAFVASMPITAILALMLGIYALLFSVIAVVAAHLFFNVRSQKGLQRRHYESLLDKRRSGENQFYLCGKPVQVGAPIIGRIRRIIAPAVPNELVKE